MKPTLFDPVTPFFRLMGAPQNLLWHENTDPSDHNYQRDNRQQAYRFFTTHFGLPVSAEEIPVDAAVLSLEEPSGRRARRQPHHHGVGPAARKPPCSAPYDSRLAGNRPLCRSGGGPRLDAVERQTSGVGVPQHGVRIRQRAVGSRVWLRSVYTSDDAPVTLVMNDKGMRAAGLELSERVHRGELVIGLDPLLIGDSAPQSGPATQPITAFTQFLASVGERPLGLEAAQLAAVARWAAAQSATKKIRLEASGMRTQTIAAVAAALHPELFSTVVIHEGLPSLGRLLEQSLEYQAAPDLFCLGLYPAFDLPHLEALAKGVSFIHPRRK